MQKPDTPAHYSQAQKLELQTLNHNAKLFEQMKQVDSALYLSKKDLSLLVNEGFKSFSSYFMGLKTSGFSKTSFGHLSVSLENSKMSSSVNFSIKIDSLNRTLYGKLLNTHSFKAGTNEFIIQTEFSEIILDEFGTAKSLADTSANRALITEVVESFLHTLKVEILNMPLSIPVNMNVLNGINGKDILSAQDFKLHSARGVRIGTKMDSYMPYISSNGVSLFGTSQIKKDFNYKDEVSLKRLKSSLQQKVKDSLKKDMGISLYALQKYSSYYLSKKYLSSQMNKALNKVDLRTINKFFVQVAEEDTSFHKYIYFFDKKDLPSCNGIRTDCAASLPSCERKCMLKFGADTCDKCDNINNPFAQVRCLSKLEACKTKAELHLYECNKTEARCEFSNQSLFRTCEIQNISISDTCELEKEKLIFVNDEIILARLELDFEVSNSYAVQRIHHIELDEDFKELQVVRDIHISVDSVIKASISNNQGADFVCVLDLNKSVKTHSQTDITEQTRTLNILTQRMKNGTMLIKAISKPNFISTQIKEMPYESLMRHKDFYMQCTYKGMQMKEFTPNELLKIQEIPYELNVMLGEIELEFKEEELSFVVTPVKIGKHMIFYPNMEKNSIGFSRQAHFY